MAKYIYGDDDEDVITLEEYSMEDLQIYQQELKEKNDMFEGNKTKKEAFIDNVNQALNEILHETRSHAGSSPNLVCSF